MIQKVFTIYDSKLEVYNQPFLAINKGHALRILSDIMKKPDHPFTEHSKDFTLFELGEYDDSKGEYTTSEAKMCVTGLWELKQPDHDQLSLAN